MKRYKYSKVLEFWNISRSTQLDQLSTLELKIGKDSYTFLNFRVQDRKRFLHLSQLYSSKS